MPLQTIREILFHFFLMAEHKQKPEVADEHMYQMLKLRKRLGSELAELKRRETDIRYR